MRESLQNFNSSKTLLVVLQQYVIPKQKSKPKLFKRCSEQNLNEIDFYMYFLTENHCFGCNRIKQNCILCFKNYTSHLNTLLLVTVLQGYLSSTKYPLPCVSSLHYMNYHSQDYLCTRLGSDNVSRCYSLERYLYTFTILKVTLYGISGSFTLNYLHFRSVLNKFNLMYVYVQSHHLKTYPAIKNLKAVQRIDQLFTVHTNQELQEVSQHTRDRLLLQQMCFCQNV